MPLTVLDTVAPAARRPTVVPARVLAGLPLCSRSDVVSEDWFVECAHLAWMQTQEHSQISSTLPSARTSADVLVLAFEVCK